MTKIIAILTAAPSALSGCYVSSNKNYLDFVTDYNQGKVRFGSLYEDKINYSKDLQNVFRDYKRAGLAYKESKKDKIGKEATTSK